MSTKLVKNTYPDNHLAEDFKAFGPPATEDGNFETVKIADLGCFTQESKDSNKYYHAAIVQSTKDNKWYVYFEWGRTGNKNPTFQFVLCASEEEAQKEFAKQLHSKNDKRGEWVVIAGIKTLKQKGKEDCYLVRPQSVRSTGLPSAKTIKINECKITPINKNKIPSFIHKNTLKLLNDLNFATVSYTRGSMADSSLPTQKSIEEARDILTAVEKRLVKVGNSIDDQLADSEIIQLTNLIYSRIPKKKPLKANADSWLLTKDNIMLWKADLDAFESALSSQEELSESNPYDGLPFTLEYIEQNTSIGTFLYNWWPKATANKHGYLGNMKIKNLWQINRNQDDIKLNESLEKISKDINNKKIKEKPLHQPDRIDLKNEEKIKYLNNNVSLLFHGSRSVNVSGILKESLRLPKNLTGVVITGAMFGPLIYFADDWKKSAGYTSLNGGYYTYGNGAIQNRGAFMFAADVICGNPHLATGPYGYTNVPNGTHCIFGKAGYSGVANNEWVIPSINQIRLKYLLEFTVKKK